MPSPSDREMRPAVAADEQPAVVSLPDVGGDLPLLFALYPGVAALSLAMAAGRPRRVFWAAWVRRPGRRRR